MKYYLKPNVVLEPLFDKWYAWAHLISPATSAMNIVNRHLKIMDSFIQAPQIHAVAVKNPKMKGGPFIDLPVERVSDVQILKDATKLNQFELIQFAHAVNELAALLKSKAKGYSLEPLYQEIPECLKGYVELVYDLNNNPSFRFFESLLYKSRFYKEQAQSIALWLTENDERPFVLSTPRVLDKGVIHIDIPFRNTAIDVLCRMKRIPSEIETVAQLLGIKEEDRKNFDSLFTSTAPPQYAKYDGTKVRMRYFGHACILVETNEISVLIDPVVSYYGYQHDVTRFSDMDLPDKIDYVLITHNHQDHVLLETLLPMRHKVGSFVIPSTTGGALQDPSLRLMFKNIGFDNVVELGELDTVETQDIKITGIPFIGEHSDLNIQAKLCYLLEIGEFKMLFVADSCNVAPELYKHIHEHVGDVGVVFIGMECDGAPLTWLYGPLLTEGLSRDQDQSRRLAGSNFERARELVDVFNPSEVYVYAMGQEPWLEYISSIKYTETSNPIVQSNKLVDYYRKKGNVAERLFGEKELFYERNSVVI